MNVRNLEPALEWLIYDDRGISSQTIWATMMGVTPPHYGDTPSNACDFGQCYRLLQAIPEWASRLPEVGKAHPQWAPFIQCWDELTKIYEAGLTEGRGLGHWRRLSKRLKDLRSE